ncbi:MAG: flagellar biosynthesis protein FlhF [Halieaceae bacterium]|jgi:flagellar biosynthesis protein FlhF|nr:flagellar biosynthesis protein FlhF [Halieaceae bacterium]
MNIQKFRGRDTREAMAQVRAEFGQDAYILANRRVGGMVELTVARDIDAMISAAGNPAAAAPGGLWPGVGSGAAEGAHAGAQRADAPAADGFRSAAGAERQNAPSPRALPVDEDPVRHNPAVAPARNTVAPASPAQAVPAEARQLELLERELKRLRDILDTELGERQWRDVAERAPIQSTLRQRLLRLGLSRALTGQLMQRLPPTASLEQGWRLAIDGLQRRLRCDAAGPGRASIVAVYGGTGVGKTSAIAKLAGRDIQRFGAQAVGLITLDGYRLGAREQLSTFAHALGIPALAADDRDGLMAALRKLRGRRVYVDTAGMGQRDPRLLAQWDLLDELGSDLAHVVAVAASSHPVQTRALLEAFGRGAFSGAIITKMDEAQSLGGVLDVVVQSAIPLWQTTDGQRIPDDIADADAAALVERALELSSRPSPTDRAAFVRSGEAGDGAYADAHASTAAQRASSADPGGRDPATGATPLNSPSPGGQARRRASRFLRAQA